MIKYRLYSGEIKPYEVVKETPKQVVYLKRHYFKSEEFVEEREMKISHWWSWHDTFEQAKNYLLFTKEQEVNRYLSIINRLNNEIEKIKLLNE